MARAAIDRQRKAVTLEASALDRLLAEVVLRPPDLRHLDAAIQALAASARRETSLKEWISDRYASRCATCDRPIVLDEVTWAAESTDEEGRPAGPRPIRKHYRCPVCRDQLGGGEQRQAPLDAADLRRALDQDGQRGPVSACSTASRSWRAASACPTSCCDLHTTRQLAALGAILERIEGDLRAASIVAALRLALLHAVAPASRLSTSAGRVAPLRITGGHVKLPGGATWRERNPWLAFEDGVRVVRGFVQRLESGAWGPVPARFGEDLRSLTEGAATAVLRQATPAALAALGLEMEHLAGTGIRPRVRLALGTAAAAPRRGAPRLGLPRHGLGPGSRGRRHAAARAPVRARRARAAGAGRPPRSRGSLRGIEPVLARTPGS